MKLWGGRFEKDMDQTVHEFTSSIKLDERLWAVDIQGSIAHARMLGQQGIITTREANEIIGGLESIYAEFANGNLTFDAATEDIHSDIEKRLTAKIGPVAGKLHTARSRNDQTATDTRLYLRIESEKLAQDIKTLQKSLLTIAEKHTETILPGMTHMQHAQPVSLAHHLLAYFWMLQRDGARLHDLSKRMNLLPLGAAALAGTSFPIDRQAVAAELGFANVIPNSLDAVSDRDHIIEFLSFASTLMMHLSRFSEELILWSTPEFAFIEMDDDVTTGSSIMPQKKNPDVAELIRGRVGRVYGALMGALTLMKSLPLSYNRDMQEDKHHLFEGLDSVHSSVRLMNLIINKTQWKTARMQAALRGDFSNATDLADDLVRKGLTFREAHEVTGRAVQYCLKNNVMLENISINELRQIHPLCDENTRSVLNHVAVMQARTSEGGTSSVQVRKQIELAYKII